MDSRDTPGHVDAAPARGLDMAARPWLTPAARAYRQLLTSQRQLFGQDRNALVQARDQTRTQFLQNADAEPDAVPAMLQDARDAADFLRENVAQTVRSDETGNFGAQNYPASAQRPRMAAWSHNASARAVLTPKPEHIHKTDKPPPLPCGE